jgi:hypothetical protein
LFDEEAGHKLDPIVDGCQVLSFRLARRRAFDPAPAIAQMAGTWDATMQGLERALL